MTYDEAARLVISLVLRALIILPLHLTLLKILPKLRGKLDVGRLKLLWLIAILPMALFVMPTPVSTPLGSGAMSYAAAIGAELGHELIVASSRALPKVYDIIPVGLTHVWILGVVCTAGRRMIDLVVLICVIERRTVWRKKRGRITIRYVDGGIASPVTYGFFSPVIAVPLSATDDAVLCRMLTMHEVTHIDNRDIIWRYAMTFLCSVYWFYPPMFGIEKELCTLSELACDAEAVGYVPSRATDYGRMLVAYSRRNTVAVGLGNSLSDGGRALLVRIESIVAPCVVTRRMERLGALLLAAVISLSLVCATFQTMVCSTRTLTFCEAEIDVPGYLGAIRETNNSVVFTIGGREVGELIRLRSYVDFNAFYKMFDRTSILMPNPNGDYDGDYLRGEFTRRNESGCFFLYSDERLGVRDSYVLCIYDSPMMGLVSAVEMARSLKVIRNSEL